MSELKIDWEMMGTDTDKPNIYDYLKSSNTYSLSSVYYSWMSGSMFTTYDACIKGVNNTNKDLKLSSVQVGTLSCHSGGDDFYWWSEGSQAYVSAGADSAKGYGGEYYVKVRVKNPDSSIFEESTVVQGTGTTSISNVTQSNMIQPGSPGPAGVGWSASFSDTITRDFNIVDCPTIKPGGVVYLHFGILSFNGYASQTLIKFSLKPSEMSVNINVENGAYIWVYHDNQWNLEKYAYVYDRTSRTWNKLKEGVNNT